jgi:hypothetical protein
LRSAETGRGELSRDKSGIIFHFSTATTQKILELEQVIMNQVRRGQKRSLGFESLEGRLALSTGMAVASPHAHLHALSNTHSSIAATFTGHTSINGSSVETPDLSGRIGRDRFAGNASGTAAGATFEGGDVLLTNSKGSIQLELGAATVTKVAGRTRQEVPMVILASTGKYAQFTGATGMLTNWSISARPKGLSSFSGRFVVN